MGYQTRDSKYSYYISTVCKKGTLANTYFVLENSTEYMSSAVSTFSVRHSGYSLDLVLYYLIRGSREANDSHLERHINMQNQSALYTDLQHSNFVT
jgi:hypothetical protein